MPWANRTIFVTTYNKNASVWMLMPNFDFIDWTTEKVQIYTTTGQ